MDSGPGSKAPADDAVLRPGDRVRVSLDFARWIGKRPTSVLTVASLTRTKDDVVILGLRWGPSAAPDGPEVAAGDTALVSSAGPRAAPPEVQIQ